MMYRTKMKKQLIVVVVCMYYDVHVSIRVLDIYEICLLCCEHDHCDALFNSAESGDSPHESSWGGECGDCQDVEPAWG